ncbi:MAG: hypothetical protein H6740_22960, partial [Alphaproteobacteria bacterium]|nr:hypothetical protein [Alphaproteobacteria bacterium]
MLRVLGVLLGLAVVVALTRQAAERAVRGPTPDPAPDQAAEPPPEVALEPTLQEVLAEATLEEERVEERQDADGHWALRHATWRLPQGQSPSVVAERLAARLKRLEGSPEVYVTAEDELDVQVRVYVGKRATLQLRLRPTLGAPARPAKRPEVALVLLGLGDLGPRARALLAEPIPFTVTVQPFSPFALRHSWDATRLDVELGVELSPADASPEAADEVLEAVFHPSAVTLVGAPASLPLDALYDRGMYIFDPAHELSPSLRRQ